MNFVEKWPEVARPYLACFVVLRRENKVAMVKRKNTNYYDGYYGLPAGKVEWDEHFRLACVREAKEEAGVYIKQDDLRFVHTVHRHGYEGGGFLDWIDTYFEADDWEGEPYNAEEHKSEGLDWIDLDNLPENIVPPQRDALEHIVKGAFYSEYGWE
jgi:ADP-ribose pyrophosphatase YjhB (NUDIX family)